MHDAAFKRLFRHPATVEMLVRAYAPRRAARIDLASLERAGTEQVGEALVRRYPDMIWTARTRRPGGRALILLEFQSTRDRLMALRMAVYQLLAVQELLRRVPGPRGRRSVEVLSFVIHHGEGSWGKPPSLRGLFGRRWTPRDYRLVAREPGPGPPGAGMDLPQAILALERDRSAEGTRATVEALRRIAERTGTEYDRFMGGCVAEMLISRGQLTREQLGEARTMAQISAAYQRSLEEYGRKWWAKGRDEGIRRGRDEGIRQGRDEGIRQERASLVAGLCGQARDRFGAKAAGELASLIGEELRSGELLDVAAAVASCATAEELLGRVRAMRGR